jgi:WD40 repeat protein
VTELARYGTGRVSSAAFSPSTDTLAVLLSTGIRLFDTSDLSAEPRIIEITNPIDGIMFSPDSSLLLGTGDRSGRVHVWDTVTLNEEAVLDAEIHFYSLDRVVFSSDGQPLVTGGRESIRLWNTENWKLLTTLHPAAIPNIATMAVSPDGTKIAASATDEDFHVHIVVLDSISGSVELSLEDEAAFQINSMAINSRNDLLAFTVYSNDATVLKVMDIQSGDTLITTEGDGVLLFSPDNKYLLANRSGQMFCLNIETKQSIRFPKDIEGNYVGQLKDTL